MAGADRLRARALAGTCAALAALVVGAVAGAWAPGAAGAATVPGASGGAGLVAEDAAGGALVVPDGGGALVAPGGATDAARSLARRGRATTATLRRARSTATAKRRRARARRRAARRRTARRPARVLKAIWGPLRTADGASAFPIYSDLGVDVLQVQLQWPLVAPSQPANPADTADPAYLWPPALDVAIEEARERGIEIALLVRGSPRWANGGRDSRWAPNPRHYARFMAAASRRYPSVRRWMVWGEPNHQSAFRPLPPDRPRGPRVYARLLDAAYGALKRVDRRDIVVGGMTFSYGDVHPAKWLRWMRLPGGRRPRLDEYGHNPFTRRPPKLRRRIQRDFPHSRDINDMDTFARELRRAYRGQRGVPRGGPRLWLSEYTVSSDRPNAVFDFAVSRRKQAAWLRGGFRIARAVGASGYGWFNLFDDAPNVRLGLTTGLIAPNGRRKPAYRAFKRLP